MASKQQELKIKVACKEDTRVLRLAHIRNDDTDSIHQEVRAFASSNFDIKQDKLTIGYLDEEGDMVTIVSSEDMRDAVEVAHQNKRVPRVQVLDVTNAKKNRTTKSRKFTEATRREEVQSTWMSLAMDMHNDEELKKEFVSLTKTWLQLMQTNGGAQLQECFGKALTICDVKKLGKHKAMPLLEEGASTTCQVFVWNPWTLQLILSAVNVDSVVDAVVAAVGNGERVTAECCGVPSSLMAFVPAEVIAIFGGSCCGEKEKEKEKEEEKENKMWKEEKKRERKKKQQERLRVHRERLMKKLEKVNAKIEGEEQREAEAEAEEEVVEVELEEDVLMGGEPSEENVEKESMVQEAEAEAEAEIETGLDSQEAVKGEKVKEKGAEVEIEEEEETPFEHADALARLVAMGFTDVEMLKSLLLAAKGSIEAVLNNLL